MNQQANSMTQNGESLNTAMFVREDWTLFRTLGTLPQTAGVPLERLRRLVVKELADNALDTAGHCEVYATSDGAYVIEDSGPGLDGAPEDIARLFSINRPLTSSKLLRLPTRGALGNGLRVVTGAVLASGGHLQVETRGLCLKLTPNDSGNTDISCTPGDLHHGTRITVYLGDAVPDDPHALLWADQASFFAVHVPIYKGKSSAFWFDTDAFYELLQAHKGSVRDVITMLDGCSGAKAGPLAGAYRGRESRSLDRDDAASLLATIRDQVRPVNPSRLKPVGALESLPFHAKVSDTFKLQPGRQGLLALLPFTLEAWAKPSETDHLTVLVNRTPIAASVNVQRQRQRQPSTVGLFGCGLAHSAKIGKKPLSLYVNIQTPYMPITSGGKEPDLRPFLVPLIETVEKVARKRNRAHSNSKTPSQKDVVFTYLADAVDKASGKGKYRYSLRQLYYATRPYVSSVLMEELQYGWFGDVITEYESQHGELPGMYRDDRGIVYHPHLGEEIPLGTLGVEAYEQPPWIFNKVLYIEKGGFFPILKEDGWAERHDCALLTSQGHATRAAKDLIDLLGESEEEILFFCIHDADGYGTRIFEALQEATKARPARKVEIINLGLEPEEALEMGLEVETFKAKKKGVPVAEYVPHRWRNWSCPALVDS